MDTAFLTPPPSSEEKQEKKKQYLKKHLHFFNSSKFTNHPVHLDLQYSLTFCTPAACTCYVEGIILYYMYSKDYSPYLNIHYAPQNCSQNYLLFVILCFLLLFIHYLLFISKLLFIIYYLLTSFI